MQLVLAYFVAILRHWGTLVTGGLVTAIITVIQYRRQKTISWNIARRILFAFVLIASFLAWREQHDRAEIAIQKLGARGGLTEVTFSMLGDLPNGTVFYCRDCMTVRNSTTCFGDGAGATAIREGTQWICVEAEK